MALISDVWNQAGATASGWSYRSVRTKPAHAPSLTISGARSYPVFGPDDTLYAGRDLAAYQLDGKPLWRTAQPLCAPPAVDQNKNVYVAEPREISAFDEHGTKRWTAQLPPDYYTLGAPRLVEVPGQTLLFVAMERERQLGDRMDNQLWSLSREGKVLGTTFYGREVGVVGTGSSNPIAAAVGAIDNLVDKIRAGDLTPFPDFDDRGVDATPVYNGVCVFEESAVGNHLTIAATDRLGITGFTYDPGPDDFVEIWSVVLKDDLTEWTQPMSQSDRVVVGSRRNRLEVLDNKGNRVPGYDAERDIRYAPAGFAMSWLLHDDVELHRPQINLQRDFTSIVPAQFGAAAAPITVSATHAFVLREHGLLTYDIGSMTLVGADLFEASRTWTGLQSQPALSGDGSLACPSADGMRIYKSM